MADNVEDQIEEVALGPKQVSVDGTTVTAHDLPALIEADKYLASKRAAAKNHFGLRFVKLEPPGTG
jgi:hypothetical protein